MPDLVGASAGAGEAPIRCPLVLIHARGAGTSNQEQLSRGLNDVETNGGPDQYTLISARRVLLLPPPGSAAGARRPEALSPARRRRYRLRCTGDPTPWRGARLRITLVYDGDGRPVPGQKNAAGPLLEFPQGCTRYGVPAAEVLLRMNAEGASDEAFGVQASTFRHLRGFRLFVERDSGGPDGGWEAVPGRVRVQTVSHAKSAAPREPPGYAESSSEDSPPLAPDAPKRPRRGAAAPEPGPGGPAPAFLPRDASRQSSRTASPEPSPPAAAEGEEGPEGQIMHALEALRDLCLGDPGYPPDPKAAPAQAAVPPLVLGIDELEAAALWQAAAAAADPRGADDGPAPPLVAKCEGMPPPFRHADAGGRAAVEGRVRAARAAVQRAAAAAGLSHPVSSADVAAAAAAAPSLLEALEAACADLAATLASEAVFDTALFQTMDGRFHTRATLEDLRLCGTAQLVHGILGHWGSTLSAALSLGDDVYPKEDAVMLAEHAWNMLDVITGPVARTAMVADLLPVPREFFFELLDRVERRLEGYTARGGDPLLAARVLARRGRALEQFRDSASAVAAYFEALSLVVRAGATPSRFEAHVIRELAEIHMRMPDSFDMGTHLVSKMYWYCETEEDMYQEAICLYTAAQEAGLRCRFREAKAKFRRCMDMLSAMSMGYRAMYPRAASLLIIACLNTFDIPTALWAFNRAFAANASLTGFGYFELDITFPLRDRIMAHAEAKVPLPGDSQPPTPETFIRSHRFAVFLLSKLSPRGRRLVGVVVGHVLFQLGQAFLQIGEWGKALGCLSQAHESLYGPYPAYFPSSLGRTQALAASIQECRQRLKLGGSLPAFTLHPDLCVWGEDPPLFVPKGAPVPPAAPRPAFRFSRPAPSWQLPRQRSGSAQSDFIQSLLAS